MINLDKDPEACSLANLVRSKVKKGFTQKDGVILPYDKDAEYKWLTGVSDVLMRQNTKHYVQELYEICGFEWKGEKYILPDYVVPNIKIKTTKKIIGVNTGVGHKWRTRKFSDAKLISAVKDLRKDYEVVLLGGPDEDKKNQAFAAATGASYFGVFPLPEFIGLVSLCDLIITPVTLTLHIAIGLEKKIVLLNNIFPTKEFHLYGLGEILEPDIPCKPCYKSKFDDRCYSKDCMDLIDNKEVLRAVRELLAAK